MLLWSVPFCMSDHLTPSKILSISRSSGGLSGLIDIGDFNWLLLARSEKASVAWRNLINRGLGRFWSFLNLPSRKISLILLAFMESLSDDNSCKAFWRSDFIRWGLVWVEGHSCIPYSKILCQGTYLELLLLWRGYLSFQPNRLARKLQKNQKFQKNAHVL